LSHLIGHEGDGSILSLLKQKGWANYLSAGCSGGASGFDFYKVMIDLTEKGLEEYGQVVALVFQYITLIRRAGVQEWCFNEVSRSTTNIGNYIQKSLTNYVVYGISYAI
jgi:insulysin